MAKGRTGGSEARLASHLAQLSAPLQAAALQGPLGGGARPAPFPKDITVQVLAWLSAWPSPLCRADL